MPPATSAPQPAGPSARYRRSQPSPSPSSSASASAAASAAPGTAAQQAFINQVAPGAVAAQRTYGVPAAVTIAQAIDESGWGQSTLATRTTTCSGSREPGRRAATRCLRRSSRTGSGSRSRRSSASMTTSRRASMTTDSCWPAAATTRPRWRPGNAPNTFAQALTGVYATDPNYGTNLISLMRRYNLYRFDPGAQSARAQAAAAVGTGRQAPVPHQAPATQAPATQAQAAATEGPGIGRPVTEGPAHRPPRHPRRPVGQRPRGLRPSPPRPPGRARPGQRAHPHRPPRVHQGHPRPRPPGSTPPAPQPKATRPAPAASQPQAAPAPAPAGSRRPRRPLRRIRSRRRRRPDRRRRRVGSPAAAATAGQAAIPGVEPASAGTPAHTSAQLRSSSDTTVVTELAAAFRPTAAAGQQARTTHAGQRAGGASADQGVPRPASAGQQGIATPGDRPALGPAAPKKATKRKAGVAKARKAAPRYQPQMPPAVRNAFLASARKPLARAELVYRDVAGTCGISWKLLAACDWMQCEAHPRYSPVRGEKLGTVNADGTVFRTKSEALTQCARDLIARCRHRLPDRSDRAGGAVRPGTGQGFRGVPLGRPAQAARHLGHGVPVLGPGPHRPAHQHALAQNRRADAPDKPGARFRRPFGAVPVVLSLEYPATV